MTPHGLRGALVLLAAHRAGQPSPARSPELVRLAAGLDALRQEVRAQRDAAAETARPVPPPRPAARFA